MADTKTQSNNYDKKSSASKYCEDSISAFVEMNNKLIKSLDIQMDACLSLFKGVETLMKTGIKLTKENLAAQSKALTQLQNCQNTNDVMTLHSDWTAQGFTKLMTDSTKLSELSLQVANETLRPIQQHFTEVVGQAIKTKTA